VDGPPAGADRQQIMQFMTTLSGAIIALALDTSRVAFAATAGEPTGPDRRS